MSQKVLKFKKISQSQLNRKNGIPSKPQEATTELNSFEVEGVVPS